MKARTYLLLFAALVGGQQARAADAPADFEHAIAPLLLRRCIECHGASDPQGGLSVITREALVKGGESGPALVPGDADQSYLIERVAAGEMPPAKNDKPCPLPPEEVATLRAWIAAGASWPGGRVLDPYERTSEARGGRDWWSLAPIVHPEVPATQNGWRVANPVDSFVGAKLAEHHLSMAPPAERRALLRRLSFDLTGLPPSAEEIDAFVADTAPAAYEKQVDRLLASPAFGERWARHWLDVVRFAETNGYERDATKPQAWKYRDWVIDSINTDKPYDQFVLEQLAGDELPGRNEQTVAGTGMLRLGTWDDEPNDQLEYKYERLEDLVHVTSTAFLALTFKCARCHDHKFDPIPQADYYRVAAVFWPGPIEPRGRELMGGPTAAELGSDALGWTDLVRDPAPFHLLRKGDPHSPIAEIVPATPTQVPALSHPFDPPAADAKTSQRRLQLARWVVDPRNPLTARVAVNRLWQHHFGEALARNPDNLGFLGQRPTHPELLDWLAAELVAGGWRQKRLHKLLVMSETYRQGTLHPSAAEYETQDAGNHWCWRANRLRLDAEALRDALLVASGQLSLQAGGPSFYPQISDEALEGLSMKSDGYPTSPADERRRRSIYIFSKRGLQLPLLTAFDACDTTQPCGRREVTIVAPQALALLNNTWIHEQSRAFAQRVLDAASDPAGRAEAAWRFALGRVPTAGERDAALAHVVAQRQHFASAAKSESSATAAVAPSDVELLAWASLCQVLVNANEFIYLD